MEGIYWYQMAAKTITLPIGSLLYFDATPQYSVSSTYSAGDKVYYNYTLWKRKTGVANTAGQTPGAGSAYWDSETVPLWQKISEHNRAPLSLNINRTEKSQRMSNGTLRKFFIADKKSFSVSWSMLPSFSNLTVDGGWGAIDIKNFYEGSIGQGTFKVKIVYGKNQTSPYADRIEGDTSFVTVSFTGSPNFEVVKRNVKDNATDPAQELWNVSISLDEV